MRSTLEGLPAGLGEGEQPHDELVHLLAARVNNLREPAPILAQRLTEILGQHLGKAVYGSKGCPQVMRNGIGEGLQRLIGRASSSERFCSRS